MQTPEVDFLRVDDRTTLLLLRLVIRVVVIGLPAWIVGSRQNPIDHASSDRPPPFAWLNLS